MRIEFSWADDVPPKSSPLRPAEMRSLFKFLDRALRGEPFYKAALGKLGVARVGSLALRFCSDVEMRELQRRFRKLDRTTDVLSFPSIEVPGLKELFPQLEASERSWGDMVISLETVGRGARRGRRSEREELAEVLAHGFLHLLGLDHIVGKGITARDAREMKALQRKLYRAWMAEQP